MPEPGFEKLFVDLGEETLNPGYHRYARLKISPSGMGIEPVIGSADLSHGNERRTVIRDYKSLSAGELLDVIELVQKARETVEDTSA